MNPRTAMELALGALRFGDYHDEAISALQEALSAPTGEPIGWLITDPVSGAKMYCNTKPTSKWETTPFYAHPPVQPLSDEEIMEALGLDGYDTMAIEHARLIEAAVRAKT